MSQPNHRLPPGLFPGSQQVVQVPRQPTSEELQQAEDSRRMMIRKDATLVGCELAKSGDMFGDGFLEMCQEIATYIETGEIGARDRPAPLRQG